MLNSRAFHLRNLAIALASVILVAACDRSADTGDEVELTHAQFNVATLHGEVLNQAPAIGQPTEIKLSGGVLWLVDGMGDPFLHAIDVRTGDHLQSVGRTGGGPGEFQAPFGLTTTNRDSGHVWAFDLRHQRITRVSPNQSPTVQAREVLLAGSPRVIRVSWLSPSLIVGVTEDVTARFVHFDSTGARVRNLPGVLPGHIRVPDSERRKSVTGFNLCASGDGLYAIAYADFGRIDVYDESGRLMHHMATPYPSEPVFETVPGDEAPRFTRTRSWYHACDATQQQLFALFSGRSLPAFAGEEREIASFLHVFSWVDGSLDRIYRLNPAVSKIAVDPAGNIYGASLATAAVYRYKIPDGQ